MRAVHDSASHCATEASCIRNRYPCGRSPLGRSTTLGPSLIRASRHTEPKRRSAIGNGLYRPTTGTRSQSATSANRLPRKVTTPNPDVNRFFPKENLGPLKGVQKCRLAPRAKRARTCASAYPHHTRHARDAFPSCLRACVCTRLRDGSTITVTILLG
jgi:hypothetical protein